jgi:hypothetical protein
MAKEDKTNEINETTEISKAEEGALVEAKGGVPSALDEALLAFLEAEEDSGLEGTDQSDYRIPRWRLLQSNSPAVLNGEGVAGMFYNTMTKEVRKELHCYMLTVGKGRTRWAKPFKKGQGPECQSFDAVKSFHGKIICKECPYQDWESMPDGQNHPDCTMRYIWACADIDENLSPFTLTAHGASVNNTKNLISHVKLNRIRLTYAKATITSEKTENQSGTFYIIDYSLDTDTNKNVKYCEDVKTAQHLKNTKEGMISIMTRAIEYDIKDQDDAFE